MKKIYNRLVTDFMESSKIDRAIIIFDIAFIFALIIFSILVFSGVLFPIEYTNIPAPENNYQELATLMNKNIINL